MNQPAFALPARGFRYSRGDMFKGGHSLMVCPTNCIGVMGAGLALWFAQKYPLIAASQRKLGGQGQLAIGRLDWYAPAGGISVACLPTKVDWRDDSRLEYVDRGLAALVVRLMEATANYASYDVGVPALGCGWGKLNWSAVDRLLNYHLNQYDITSAHSITIYQPD